LGHLALCAAVAVSAFGQPPGQPESRPRIGIALEGGGALGLAHIGVLEWLEEHHIPIDYVAGTSMGGLVGGLYSTGMRPAEIRKLISTIEWEEVLRGQPRYEDLSFRRKEDRQVFQNNLEFGLRNGINFPSGLNAGQQITFILDRATLPYSSLKSFDQLPIPFRCVATNLTTGKEKVFEDGPLGEALRATMSLPGVFNPVQRGENVYADGGLLNNLPVEVVRRMGADIVIAVRLTPASFNPKDTQSMFSILGRSISVMIAANELRSMELADLTISVDLAGFTSSDYKAAEKIIAQGYGGAARKSGLLSRLAVGESTWQLSEARRESRRIRSTGTPEFIQVTGVDSRLSHGIETALSRNVGAPVDPARLERDINVIAGGERFSSLSYSRTQRDGTEGLLIHADEKDYAPPFLNLGFLIDGSEYDNVLFTFGARITAMDVGRFRSEWRTDISAGSIWGLKSEYYSPFTATSKWFFAPRVYTANRPLDLYVHSLRIADYRILRYGTGFDVGYAINRSSELRIGYDVSEQWESIRTGLDVLPTPHGRLGASSIRYTLDKLDSPVIPRKGEIVRLNAQWINTAPGARAGFPESELYFGVVRPISKPASIYVQGYGGTTFGYSDTGLPQFFLGGPGQFSAYGANEIRTNQYFLLRLGYIHELFTLPPLVGNKAYLFSTYEAGKAYGAPTISRLPTDGAVGVVMETLFGPLAIGASTGDTGHRKWYFALGRFF
jgi:NTE family protein